MSDEKHEGLPTEGVRALVERGTAGALGVAGTAIGGPVMGVALSATASALFGLMRDHVLERGAARRDRLLAEVAARIEQQYGPGREKLAKLGATAEEALYQAGRLALDAVDPDVIPALASLAAEYVERPLDHFFRGASRVLADLTAAEHAELRGLVARIIKEVPAAATALSLEVVAVGESGEREVGKQAGAWEFTVRWSIADEKLPDHFVSDHRSWWTPAQAWRLLFHKLKVHGLADDLPAGFDVKSGPQSLSMLRSVAVRLDHHLAATVSTRRSNAEATLAELNARG
jgi:hypothetical protein